MTAAARLTAAGLPEGTIVVDDLRGIVWYANAQPGDEDRWTSTEYGGEIADSVVEWALRHGATVVRHGDGEDTR